MPYDEEKKKDMGEGSGTLWGSGILWGLGHGGQGNCDSISIFVYFGSNLQLGSLRVFFLPLS